MTVAWSVTPVDPASFSWAAADGPSGELRRVLDAATEADGRSALDEAARLGLRHHGLDGALLLRARPVDAPDAAAGFALVRAVGSPPLEVDLAVLPSRRGDGAGAALAEAVLERFPGVALTAWSHGGHPAAARLAASHGLARVRDLWVMRRSLAEPVDTVQPPAGVVVRTFRPEDAEALLSVNAAAFARHPEQGRMSRADLDARMAEPWFDPAGLFLAVGGAGSETPGALLGFHWTKQHDARVGEVYVVGISPAAQGLGLGRLLTATGLRHLAERGLDEVILYVEADNSAAVALYGRLGFTHDAADTDVQYALSAAPPSA